MSVSFCLPHPVAVSAFMICRGLCACTEMLWMCVLYVSFGSKVRPRTFGRVAMGSALLFIVRSRFLVYSAGSGVNRVQVVLSGFSKRLFCFVQAKTLCRYDCMYFLAALVLVCVDVIIRLRYYSPFVTGHIYSLQTYGITFTRFLSFLCLSVHTSPKYFIVSFSTSSFTSTYPFITPIVLSFSSSTSHVLSHLLLTMS